jgi:hypothetical protein
MGLTCGPPSLTSPMSARGSDALGALSVYAYPWDVVGDPSALEMLTSMPADRVVLAAAYHSVRAATPRHPRHRVVDARWSAVYAPFRSEAFTAQPIAPRHPGDWIAPDAFTAARRSLISAGLDVGGWVALTHIDGETGSDEFRVANAFGDVYRFALCPSHDAVLEYATTVVRETVQSSELSSIVIEAWSQLGIAHASEHDKTTAAGWTDADMQLLSICFCVACTRIYRMEGADVDLFRANVKSAVGTSHAESVRDEWSGVVLSARTVSRRRMLSAIHSAARDAGAGDIELHADDQVWGTGPSGTVMPEDAVPAVIAPAWRVDQESIDRIARMAGSHSVVAAYVSILGAESADELARFWQAILAAGARSLHLYHFGLGSADRVLTTAAAFQELRAWTAQGGPHDGHR